MKKIKITWDYDACSILKETKEERKERLRMAETTRTKVVPNRKKKYNRQEYKRAEGEW